MTRTSPGTFVVVLRISWVIPLLMMFGTACPSERPTESENAKSGAKRIAYEDVSRLVRGDLPEIRERGELRIILYGNAPGLLPRLGNPAIQNETLAEDFAQQLGLTPVFIVVERQEELLPALLGGKGDLIAAQLTVTSSRSKRVAFARSRLSVDEILVGHKTADSLVSTEQLDGRVVHVRRTSSYADTLRTIERERDIDIDIRWVPEDRSTVDLILDVASRKVELTAADSNILMSVQAIEDDIRPVLTLAEDRELAWAVRPESKLLRSAVDRYVLERALTEHDTTAYKADLPEIEEKGVLRVLTRNNPVSYFLHRGRQYGFDYALMKRFAEDLGVRLQVVVVPTRDQLVPWLLQGRGDVVAATLTATEKRAGSVRFSTPYLFSEEVLVKKKGSTSPSSLDGVVVHVRRSSSYAETLRAMQASGTQVVIEPVDEDVETEEIARWVEEGKVRFTVMDSFLLEVEQAYGSELEADRVLESAPAPPNVPRNPKADGERGRPVCFATRPKDKQLGRALDSYVERSFRGLHYNIVKKRYFDDVRRIERAIDQRTGRTGQISKYDHLFRKYARRYGLDWRLMAAQSYVESRFDPSATSWTGARGLFQLLPQTARSLGFQDTNDPEQGIHAGIKYMARLLSRFDADIPLRERIYFALAAFNVGLGHVYDARRLAEQSGKDPSRWFENVEEAMLLLAKPEYAQRARHGYCRGTEPVAYVRHIQDLYESYVKVAEL
ncbi:MAG: transporter substrate-binding domain-containing protein [Myxococcota bacterium]